MVLSVNLKTVAMAAFAALAGSLATGASAETLRVVMHSDLKIVDPIWTTAYITRNHGYMIYDTLFAMDEKGEIQPQMVESWTVSDDKLAYRFTLREGLVFHDGAPVTAADAAASIERWGTRDTMGIMLMSYVDSITAEDDRSFTLKLTKPYGLVLHSLGKPSSQVPFVMPRRVAETPGTEQISDFTGSGPFRFLRDEWRPGAISVYEKFQDYRPRSEAPSWGAGGKVVKLDRVEWVTIPDQQTAINALLAGEIDLVEQPAHDLLPIVEDDENIVLFDQNPLGNQYMFRFNSLWPPFDDPKVRQAALQSFNQEDFLQAVIGDPDYYKVCAALFVCDTPFGMPMDGDLLIQSHFDRSKELLAEAGYDGTPVLLMHSTDLQVLTNLAPVAKQLLERGGFTVDMQSMDWQTLVARRAKKEKPAEGGWNAFMTNWVAADVLNPISTAALNATGDKGWFGWFDDPQLEAMKREFAEATDPARQKELAALIQTYAITELGTHAFLGQWYQPMAIRSNVTGVLEGPAPYFWNIEKGS